MRCSQRIWTAACVAAALAAPTTRSAHAVINVAGELVVDLRAGDLEGGSNTWFNHDTAGATVGDFVTKDTQNTNIAANISDGATTVPFSLHVPQNNNKAMLSSLMTPAAIEGNNPRSIEAWVYPLGTPNGATVVGWGTTGNGMLSSFRYAGLSNGMFSGWFIDAGWGGATLPVNGWTHVAYTYNGTSLTGYVNGAQVATADLSALANYPLATASAFLGVGAGRDAGTDAFNGYIADVRVHTGVLSAGDIVNNFGEGIAPVEGVAGDFDNDGDLDSADLATLRSNLFTAGVSSEGDINRDGFIDWTDWRMFKDNPLRQVGIVNPAPAPNFAGVPEPSSVACFALAAFSLSGPLSRRIRRLAE